MRNLLFAISAILAVALAWVGIGYYRFDAQVYAPPSYSCYVGSFLSFPARLKLRRLGYTYVAKYDVWESSTGGCSLRYGASSSRELLQLER